MRLLVLSVLTDRKAEPRCQKVRMHLVSYDLQLGIWNLSGYLEIYEVLGTQW